MTELTLHGTWLTPDRGRPLLVVGPSLGTGVAALWDRCARTLAAAADVDVLGWDLPGHGDGPPHDAEFTVEDLAGAVVNLVETARPGAAFRYAGVSVGGVVGLALAQGEALAARGHDPARVRGSAVICSAARPGTPQAWQERADLVRREGMSVMVEGSRQRWFAPRFVEREPEAAGALLDTLEHADPASYARVCEALGQADLRARLGSIAIPVLVLGGRHDPVFPPEQQQELAAAVPGARLVIVQDAAHLAPAEAPEEVASLLAGWVGDGTDEASPQR
ncbi:alpha/beta fold hydrolase [Ornithinimicrobium flavum]|uniref:alpha/beta fold hydrolase n=1 Tax=Ornithinimicrobium flavum TaxID=1288636 RepID=UPI0010706795|nr:alpha/beta fold hydrolase [Ornithinimicrobium flavum]